MPKQIADDVSVTLRAVKRAKGAVWNAPVLRSLTAENAETGVNSTADATNTFS